MERGVSIHQRNRNARALTLEERREFMAQLGRVINDGYRFRELSSLLGLHHYKDELNEA